MISSQQLYYGKAGQVIYHDAPFRPSAADAPTVHENTAADSAPVSAVDGAATIDPVATTVNGTSGLGVSDPHKILLASLSDIAVDRTYLITSTLGAYERVDVRAIGDDHVIVRHPLQNTYLTASTFVGTRITATIGTAWAQTIANATNSLAPRPRYRVRWPYTLASGLVTAATMMDLLPYVAADGVLARDVDDFFPGFVEHLPTHHRCDQGRRLIAAARKAVRFDIRREVKVAHMMRDPESMDLLTVYRANVLHQENRILYGAATVEAVSAARESYALLFLEVMNAAPWSNTNDGAADLDLTANRKGLFARSTGPGETG